MKRLLSVVAAAALTIASLPAWSQTNPSGDQTRNPPGAGGTSKPGVAGQPGNKSGPAAGQSGTSTPPSGTGATTSPSQDSSKVQGLPGNKSGPSERTPGENEKEKNSSRSR